ncbi:MAG: PstS family phosphate ABC transporter substrate-binding protein [Bacteroidota bacterium]|jgi:phosphate transport system substrate-binding protein|nr:substrate-binding domain-containing protein [Sphingobacteriales bacterium]
MMKRQINFFMLAIGIVAIASCGGNSTQNKGEDTATSGTITVSADESLKPIIEAEKAVFESIYPNAHLKIFYTNEYDAVDMVMKDSARIAIVTREMLPEEKAALDAVKITPRYSPFAYDAIALILNLENKDTVFTIDQLKQILDGTYTTWNQLNPKSTLGKLQVVFDNPKSGAVRHLTDSVLKGGKIAPHCFAVQSNPEVIAHVEQNKNAIGIIGVNWISDKDDSLMRGFLSKIKVAELVPVNMDKAEARTMKPWQAYISLKQYPLWRKVQILSREARVGLGTGFASFIASDKGQRIVLKSGLVPATAPIRIIEVNNEGL